MPKQTPQFTTRLAQSDADIRAAQRLRYDVFVKELGATHETIDHENRREADRFDPFYDHLLLIDEANENCVVGVYRLLRSDMVHKTGGFYSQDEYDLTPLVASGRKLLELGRSCLHSEYRGGAAMMVMWQALADYVATHQIEVLFGVASFHGTDPKPFAQALSFLHHNHLAPEHLRVQAYSGAVQTMDLVPQQDINRKEAIKQVPALIKAYLRLGGFVGQGAFVDQEFNTTDVFLVLDTERMNKKQTQLYTKARA